MKYFLTVLGILQVCGCNQPMSVVESKSPTARSSAIEAESIPDYDETPAETGTEARPNNSQEAKPNNSQEAKPSNSEGGCLKTQEDMTKVGPYKVATTPGGTGFTIFYPSEIASSPCKHPILAWGNGTGVSGAGVYTEMNTHYASYGFVVIASHGAAVGSGAQQRAGLDYLVQQDTTSDSPLFGKLAVNKGGVTGHSQGGIGAVAASSHPAVVAIVSVQGGGNGAKKPHLQLAGTEDVFLGLVLSSYNSSTGPAFLAEYSGADHINTTLNPASYQGGQFRRLMIGWFRCYLDDDQKSCSMFKGQKSNTCGICQDKGLTKLDSKNLE